MNVKDKATAIIFDFDIGMEVHAYCGQEMNIIGDFTTVDKQRFFDWCKQRIEHTQIVVAITDNKERQEVVEKIKEIDPKKFSFPNVLLTSSFYTQGESLGEGNIILMDSVIGWGVQLGNFNIIDIGAIMMPLSQLRDFRHIKAGQIVPRKKLDIG